MDNIEAIRKRLNPDVKKSKGRLYALLMGVMMIMALCLGFLIYAKQNPNGDVFGINMATINDKIGNKLGNLFNLNIFPSTTDQPVNTTVKYQSVGNDRFKTDDQSIPTLKDGTVTYTTQQDGTFFAVVAYDNGITASYFEIEELLVKVNDRLKTGDIIGSYTADFRVLFVKGSTPVTYEEASK